MVKNKKEEDLNLYSIHYIAKEKVIGFIDFIRTQGIMGLAIGFMLGDKIKNLVNSFTTDIVNPFLVMLSGSTGELVSAKVNILGANVSWGRFASHLLDFLLMALIIYVIFKILSLDKLDKPKN